MTTFYWIGQRVCSGFSKLFYRKTQMNFLANPLCPATGRYMFTERAWWYMKPFCTKGWEKARFGICLNVQKVSEEGGKGWDKARFGICLNVQKVSEEDTQKMNTVVTKSNRAERFSIGGL